MGELYTPTHLLIILLFGIPYAAIIVPFWQIFKKAGWPAQFSLLMLVPLVNLIMLYVLAFSTWKTPVVSVASN
jgi:hypothetical protein